jgi:beta-lactamase superfamily II metal-dependent hydrolase
MRRYCTVSTIACMLCGVWWLLVLLIPAHASGNQWYVFSWIQKECVQSVLPGLKSPDTWERLLRSVSQYRKTVVARDDSGKIYMVEVVDNSANTNQNTVFFFPTKDACEQRRSYWIAIGTITDPEELK